MTRLEADKSFFNATLSQKIQLFKHSDYFSLHRTSLFQILSCLFDEKGFETVPKGYKNSLTKKFFINLTKEHTLVNQFKSLLIEQYLMLEFFRCLIIFNYHFMILEQYLRLDFLDETLSLL